MTEYIEREKAMSFPLANDQYDHVHADPHFIAGCETYKGWLSIIPAADVVERPRWISVTEKLPEKDCNVLAYYGFNHDGYLGMMFMQVLDYYAHDPKPHFQHEGSNGMTVTHWMPLPPAPEPPREEA